MTVTKKKKKEDDRDFRDDENSDTNTFDQSFESILRGARVHRKLASKAASQTGKRKAKRANRLGFGSLRDWLGSWTLSRSTESLGEGIFVSPDGMTTTTTNLEERKKERIRIALGQLKPL